MKYFDREKITEEVKTQKSDIELAQEKLDEATKSYKVAKDVVSKIYTEADEKAAEIYEDANKRVDSILKTAKQKLKEAEDNLNKAIAEENKKSELNEFKDLLKSVYSKDELTELVNFFKAVVED